MMGITEKTKKRRLPIKHHNRILRVRKNVGFGRAEIKE
jgi:hypothetical protein